MNKGKIMIALLMALCMIGGVMAVIDPLTAEPGNGFIDSTASETVSIYDNSGSCGLIGLLMYGWPWPALGCDLGLYSTTVNLLSLNEGDSFVHTIVVDGVPYGPYTSTIDENAPTAPSVLTAHTGDGDMEIDLVFAKSDDGTGSGVDHYNVYEGASILPLPTTIPGIYTGAPSEATVIASALGLHDYTVKAVDALGHESVVSNAALGVEAKIAPAHLTDLDLTECVKGVSPCHVEISFDKDIDGLKITSGVAPNEYVREWTFAPPTGLSAPIDWYPPLDMTKDATYFFDLVATQMGVTLPSESGQIDIGAGSAVDVTIGGDMTSIVIDDAYAVKGNAINNGMDWVVLGFDLTLTGNTNVLVSLGDFINGPTTIINLEDDIPYTGTAIAFCKDDYNTITQDIKAAPSVTPVFIGNTYDSPIDCSAAGGSVYIKVGVPAGALTGDASTTINFMN